MLFIVFYYNYKKMTTPVLIITVLLILTALFYFQNLIDIFNSLMLMYLIDLPQ